jgi:hypothetical protein
MMAVQDQALRKVMRSAWLFGGRKQLLAEAMHRDVVVAKSRARRCSGKPWNHLQGATNGGAVSRILTNAWCELSGTLHLGNCRPQRLGLLCRLVLGKRPTQSIP